MFVGIRFSIVLLPGQQGRDRGEHRRQECNIKGRNVFANVQEFVRESRQFKSFGRRIGHEARQDGHNRVAKGRPRKGLAQVGFELGIGMRPNEPGFKNGKEQTGGNTSQQSSKHENIEILEVCARETRVKQ